MLEINEINFDSPFTISSKPAKTNLYSVDLSDPNLNTTPTSQLLNNNKTKIEDFDKIILNSSKLNANNQDAPLTAETLKILSEINIDNLNFNSKVDLLFNDLGMLKASAVQGCLEGTNLRFLAWMIFLECIPIDKQFWIQKIQESRTKYDKIKNDLYSDPRNNNNNSNLSTVDHPFSQDQQSNWNKYFDQKEIKTVIIQDVMRINHHSKFFDQPGTKNLITNLLFIYIQSEKTDYKQGMHEILTCIIYVLNEEYSNLSKSSEKNEIVHYIANLDYLEHDAFILFRALMARIHDWFGTKTKNQDEKNHINTLSPKLFRENEEFYESAIIKKIEYISNVILRNNDIEVFNHLKKIDVTLHPFGIRWLRLLFLRELEFPFSLVLWDAIFATDNQEFCLVDFVFVALLTCLRDDILTMDNSSCMKFLMQPHYNLDPNDVLKTALYLQNPAIYLRPTKWNADYSFELINHSKYSIPTGSGSSSTRIKFSQTMGNIDTSKKSTTTSTTTSNQKSNNVVNSIKNPVSSNDNDFSKIAKKLDYDIYAPNIQAHHRHHNRTSENNKKNNYEMKLIKMQHMLHNVDLVNFTYINKITELQIQNESLKHRLTELNELCTLCSTKMQANIGLIQDEVALKSPDLNNDDLFLLAIAGLKQVRDQLNPTFREDESKMNERTLSSQMNQTTQTSVNNSESSSSIDLTSINNDTFLINKTNNIKNKISSIFKQNKTADSALTTTESTTTDNNSSSESPIHKIRSMSLKNFQSNFIPSNLSFNNIKKNSKTSINNVDNEFDQFVKLEDADLIGINFNNENMKLVLNESDKVN